MFNDLKISTNPLLIEFSNGQINRQGSADAGNDTQSAVEEGENVQRADQPEQASSMTSLPSVTPLVPFERRFASLLYTCYRRPRLEETPSCIPTDARHSRRGRRKTGHAGSMGGVRMRKKLQRNTPY